MAGITMVYLVGGIGGFMGADGINPVEGMVFVGDGNRRWYECRYFDSPGRPLGKIKSMVPAQWDDPDNLLDALIVFFPGYFTGCPTFSRIAQSLSEHARLDFDLSPPDDLNAWKLLREEARTVLKKMYVWKAELVRV